MLMTKDRKFSQKILKNMAYVIIWGEGIVLIEIIKIVFYMIRPVYDGRKFVNVEVKSQSESILCVKISSISRKSP